MYNQQYTRWTVIWSFLGAFLLVFSCHKPNLSLGFVIRNGLSSRNLTPISIKNPSHNNHSVEFQGSQANYASSANQSHLSYINQAFEPILLESGVMESLGPMIAEMDDDGGSQKAGSPRESRRLNPLRGLSLWNKPKVSPLYLINGTVCRFVNANPICTTLTTNGLLPTGAASTPRSAAVNGGSSVVFASQNQAPPAPLRPAAVTADEDMTYVNLENIHTADSKSRSQQLSLNGLPTSGGKTQPVKSQQTLSSTIPENLVGKRTLNFLSLKKPGRLFQ